MIAVGSLVKAVSEVDEKTSIVYQFGKVIYIGKRVLVEFERNVCGHNGNGIGKNRHCWMCDWNAIKEVVSG